MPAHNTPMDARCRPQTWQSASNSMRGLTPIDQLLIDWPGNCDEIGIFEVVHPGAIRPDFQPSGKDTRDNEIRVLKQIVKCLQRNAGVEIGAAVFELDKVDEAGIKILAKPCHGSIFGALHIQLEQMHVFKSAARNIGVESCELN